MNNFPANQLAEAEKELSSLAFHAERMSWDVGQHADAMRWDKMPMESAAAWLAEMKGMRLKLDRAEGLLRAYEMVWNARQGELNDYACAG